MGVYVMCDWWKVELGQVVSSTRVRVRVELLVELTQIQMVGSRISRPLPLLSLGVDSTLIEPHHSTASVNSLPFTRPEPR
jgi:hypothetical protein